MPTQTESPTKPQVQDLPVKLIAAGAFAVMVLAQVLLPLTPDHAPTLVTTVVSTLAIASILIASFTWGPKQILKVSVLVPIGLVIEIIGVSSGFPFGGYEYGAGLQPQVFGVPLVVPLAWTAMTLASWEIARRASSSKPVQLVVGGLAITAWDLFLDPLMVGYGYWIWDDPNGWSDTFAWQGIPFSNFAGWLLVGTALCAVAAWALGPARPNAALAGLYVWMTGFSALGFLLPFAFDRPAAGVVVLLAAAPLVVVALRPRNRPWLRP